MTLAPDETLFATMHRTRIHCVVCAGWCALYVAASSATGSTDFQGIQVWAGEGPLRAALVVDWSEQSASEHALVWGFRFFDGATGLDMLLAALAADDRFSAKVGDDGPLGPSVFGLGYDWNGDGLLALSDGTLLDGGVAISPPADGSTAIDPIDVYAEGWFISGYWHYAIANSNPYADVSAWVAADVGPASRLLVDGGWDAWTFTPHFTPALPDPPQAAPDHSYDGDFERDLDVDGGDLLLLQRTFGMIAAPYGAGADVDRNGIVDIEDQFVWQQNFGAYAPESIRAAMSIAVAEPQAQSLCWAAMAILVSLCPGAQPRQFLRSVSIRFLHNKGDCDE